MSESKHTPGPWYATGTHVQSASLNVDNYVCRAEGDTPEQAEANAQLIAVAPELLEALEYARRMMTKYSDVAYVDSIIAKAKG